MSSDKIVQGMNVIGADGVHVGIVEGIEGDRVRLAMCDSGEGPLKGHTHFIDCGLVAVALEEERRGKQVL